MKEFKSYLKQTESVFQSIYSNGYTDGYNSAKEEYGAVCAGIASEINFAA